MRVKTDRKLSHHWRPNRSQSINQSINRSKQIYLAFVPLRSVRTYVCTNNIVLMNENRTI